MPFPLFNTLTDCSCRKEQLQIYMQFAEFKKAPFIDQIKVYKKKERIGYRI
jgi:hypothetical protein